MKLEVDKYYKTRSGRKVKLLHERKTQEFIGVFLDSERTCVWYDDGTLDRHEDDPYDLVAEWVDPAPQCRLVGAWWVYVTEDGYPVSAMTSTEPTTDRHCYVKIKEDLSV